MKKAERLDLTAPDGTRVATFYPKDVALLSERERLDDVDPSTYYDFEGSFQESKAQGLVVVVPDRNGVQWLVPTVLGVWWGEQSDN
jgi:hypothetical protein